MIMAVDLTSMQSKLLHYKVYYLASSPNHLQEAVEFYSDDLLRKKWSAVKSGPPDRF